MLNTRSQSLINTTAGEMMIRLLLTFALTIFHIDLSIAGSPVIVLPNGLIRGREAVTIKNKSYFVYEKIPYARAPIGPLRFKAPQPPQNWDGILNTTHLDVTCYRRSVTEDYESEDCLYINVYTPKVTWEDQPLPVMLYIHGGGFTDLSSLGAISDPILEKDVILVTLNYRLGPFGFLSTGDEIIPGNNGLKDQHLAIKWVHKNINLFGGDPEQITIFGISAGSASCAYHLLNQDSTGLFRAAILESGSFLSPWAYQRRAKEISFATAAFINNTFSTSNDSSALLNFLLTVDAKTLDSAALQYYRSEVGPKDSEILQGFYWAPVVEVEHPDAFLTQKMYGLLRSGNVVKVPIIIGVTSEESLPFYIDPNALKSYMKAYDENLAWLVPNDMHVVDETIRTNIGRQMRDIYTGGKPLSDHLGDGVRYSSDTSFTRPIIKHAELFSKVSKVYFYQLSYDGKLGGLDVHYDGAESVGHGEDGNYIFCSGSGCDTSSYPESDIVTRKRIIELWTNFAKYQNPTPQPQELLQNITWPFVSTNDGNLFFLDINKDLHIKNHPKKETYDQWIKIYNNLGYDDFDTY